MNIGKPYLIFFLIVAAGLLFSLMISWGYYPVAMVDRTVISGKEFWEHYRFTSADYANFIKTYASGEIPPPLPGDREIEAVALNELVERELIHKKLASELGADFAAVVQNKLKRFDDDAKLKEAVGVLYRLNFDRFREAILRPQAERDLLGGRLFLAGRTIEDWLAESKRGSAVRIFSRALYWDGEEVKIRNENN